ncbi:hypothetical protein WJX73_009693 [Symbiochloris irregularis]|uniref:Hydroxyproline O-arabinosyltransferase-like domain-containing protein n=1 Tax=Symbiochloris irregularis TaxID=706552 RepID=A0AAW1NX10_9CHLO
MRVRNLVLLTAGIAVFVTSLNFLTDSFSLLSRLPDASSVHRIEAARREAKRTPFEEREHRLERRPRLESQDVSVGSHWTKQQEAAAGSHQQHKRKRRLDRQDAGLKIDRKAPDPFEMQHRYLPPANPPAPKAVHDSPPVMEQPRQQAQQMKPPPTKEQRNKYHVVVSVNGNLYTQWQVRVCYYWYQKLRKEHPTSAIGGFTRLLHSGQADGLMAEIPTKVVEPLPPGIDKGYVVLNRPYAFLQWSQKYLKDLEEDYVLMSEPDHIFLQPMPLWATPTKGAAFPFSYMEPGKNQDVLRPYITNGFDIAAIAPIGNSPVMLHKDNMSAIMEPWYDLSLRFKKDSAVEKAFGWILEMYAYAVASTQKPGGNLPYELHPEMMLQPPWDNRLSINGKDAYILHFTYGNDYSEQGQMTYGKVGSWHFDKRDYTALYPPKNIPDLPRNIDSPALRRLIASINEASAASNSWQYM